MAVIWVYSHIDEMAHQMNFHIFQKSAEFVHSYDYFSNPKNITDLLKCYNYWKICLSVILFISINITRFEKAAVMVY